MSAKWFGFNPPFIGPAGVLTRQEDTRLIKNDILQLIMTAPGERVHRPSFGTPVRALVHELLNESSLDNIRHKIVEAMDQEPRVNLLDVILVLNPDESLLEITIVMSLKSDPTVKFDLATKLNAPGTII